MGKLQEAMQREMELKGYSIITIKNYLGHMRRYTIYLGRSPVFAGEVEVKRYLSHLISDQKCSRSHVNQTFSALKVFYEKVVKKPDVVGQIPRIKQAKKLPVVLSTGEVSRLLTALPNLKHRTILTVIYSAGLRLSEVCHLKVSDIDSDRMQIRVRQGKGMKDRYTLLAKGTVHLLRLYWQAYRPADWLFPGQDVTRPLSDRSVQKIFKKALSKAEITKEATVHTLRHCFATHLLETGVDVYYIQKLMGHASVNTTSIYLHVTGRDLSRITSPLDLWDNPPEPTL